jgi:hypothetical protein
MKAVLRQKKESEILYKKGKKQQIIRDILTLENSQFVYLGKMEICE